VAGEYDHILRFSSRQTEDYFIVGNNLLNFESVQGRSDWIDLSFREGSQTVLFRAKSAETIEDRPDALFSIFYAGSNSFGRVVMESRTYNFLCQWDEEGPLEEDREYSASLLSRKEGFSDPGEDSDVFSFKPSKQGYCLEVSASNDFLVSARQEGLFWDEASEIFYDAERAVAAKRLYLTNAFLGKDISFSISRPPGEPERRTYYRFSLRPIRPLVLVHGIRSSPVSPADRATSFGEIREKAPRYGLFPPLLVFDFPWDSDKGSISDYCGRQEGSLGAFAADKCRDWKLKPVFFAHSMGGLLVLEQLRDRDFFSSAGGFIFAGSPFCGSDLANFFLFSAKGKVIKKSLGLLNKVRTTDANIRLLARGSRKIWERLKNFRRPLRTLFLVGYQNEDAATGRGDTVVNISSAGLPKSLEWAEPEQLVLYMQHNELVDIDLPPSDKYGRLCRKLCEILEH